MARSPNKKKLSSSEIKQRLNDVVAKRQSIDEEYQALLEEAETVAQEEKASMLDAIFNEAKKDSDFCIALQLALENSPASKKGRFDSLLSELNDIALTHENKASKSFSTNSSTTPADSSAEVKEQSTEYPTDNQQSADSANEAGHSTNSVETSPNTASELLSTFEQSTNS